MADELRIDSNLGKAEQYQMLIPQIRSLISAEPNGIANLANVSAALRTAFGFWWVGFYLVHDDQLVLGPFQGPIACTRISFGKGVCGTAWKEGKTLIVDDVEEFPGHIACSAESRSEIVVPIFKQEKVIGVLDVDSEKLAHFDQVDQTYLEELMGYLAEVI